MAVSHRKCAADKKKRRNERQGVRRCMYECGCKSECSHARARAHTMSQSAYLRLFSWPCSPSPCPPQLQPPINRRQNSGVRVGVGVGVGVREYRRVHVSA